MEPTNYLHGKFHFRQKKKHNPKQLEVVPNVLSCQAIMKLIPELVPRERCFFPLGGIGGNHLPLRDKEVKPSAGEREREREGESVPG